jgi:pyruvate formate lyase activating enzyme
VACGIRCLIREGRRGVCGVRVNRGGELRVPWGYVAGLQVDPIEKKPFFHLLPGTDALTFGMLGCNYHCAYCQNSLTSQALRDPASDPAGGLIRAITPAALARLAQQNEAPTVVSSYNEPLITSEWAVAIFKEARAVGRLCAYVSNGNATPQVLTYLRPYLDAFKIDLKTMQDRQYRRMGGVLNHVLDTIRLAHDLGLWVEVVTLVVPGLNDSSDELRDAAEFIAAVAPTIPWHVTAFHPDYHLTDADPTPSTTLLRAAEIGRAAGLQFVYTGNRPGRTADWEATRCPSCGAALIERRHFSVLRNRLTPQGTCPECGHAIPGIWARPIAA